MNENGNDPSKRPGNNAGEQPQGVSAQLNAHEAPRQRPQQQRQPEQMPNDEQAQLQRKAPERAENDSDQGNGGTNSPSSNSNDEPDDSHNLDSGHGNEPENDQHDHDPNDSDKNRNENQNHDNSDGQAHRGDNDDANDDHDLNRGSNLDDDGDHNLNDNQNAADDMGDHRLDNSADENNDRAQSNNDENESNDSPNDEGDHKLDDKSVNGHDMSDRGNQQNKQKDADNNAKRGLMGALGGMSDSDADADDSPKSQGASSNLGRAKSAAQKLTGSGGASGGSSGSGGLPKLPFGKGKGNSSGPTKVIMGAASKALKPVKRIVKAHLLLIIAGFVMLFLMVGMLTAIFSSTDRCQSGTSNAANTTASTGTSGVGGTWSKKGTTQYNNAKKVWDSLKKDMGFSGAALAGALGNMAQESGFVTAVNNSTGDGGHGLMQWTFGRRTELTAFAKKMGKPEDDIDLQIAMVEHDLKNPAMWASGKYSDNSLKKFASDDDVTDATMRFYMSGLEIGQAATYDKDGSGVKRVAYAKTIYKMFDGADVEYDPSAMGAAGAADAGAESDTQETAASGCSTSVDSTTDGTGKVPDDLPYGKNIAADKIPDDVKKFLLPNTLSDSRGVPGKGWVHLSPGDQCVDYSVSRTVAVWGGSSWSKGNGGAQATYVASIGHEDKKPKAGDIGSSQGYPPTAEGEPGHTWFVEHVFADGSVLLSEQNGPESGAYIGMSKTWSIILMHPYPDGKEWKTANGGEYQKITAGAHQVMFAHPRGHMKK